MVNLSEVRFVIDLNNKPRAVLSARNRSNGDVGLYLRPPSYLRNANHAPFVAGELRDRMVKNQYYSIHKTGTSNTLNALSHTTTFGDKPEELHTTHYTEALKVHDNFAHVFSRRCTTLIDTNYTIKKQKHIPNISMGSIDVTKFTLFFSVFIGNATRRFNARSKDLNVVQTAVGSFRIVILYSFMTLPAQSSGLFLHTVNPSNLDLDNDPELIEAFLPTRIGHSEAGCIEHHQINEVQSLDEARKTCIQNGEMTPNTEKIFGIATYLKHPTYTLGPGLDYLQRFSQISFQDAK